MSDIFCCWQFISIVNFEPINFQERQAKAAAQKADFEAQIDDLKEKVNEEQARKEQLLQDKRALDAEVRNKSLTFEEMNNPVKCVLWSVIDG